MFRPKPDDRARRVSRRRHWPVLAAILAIGLRSAAASPALTLEQLRQQPDLTPEHFARCFRDFRFKLGDQLQAPDVFLANQCGDCDDFACLADQVLRERKYTTRLIAVFMDGETHVVCYVQEVHGYLDYNCRRDTPAVQPSSGDIQDVANRVAAYFRVPWRSASEFTYQAGHPRFGRIVFH